MEEDEQIRGKNTCWPIRTVLHIFLNSYCPASLGQDCCLDVFSDPFSPSIMPMSVLYCCMCVCVWGGLSSKRPAVMWWLGRWSSCSPRWLIFFSVCSPPDLNKGHTLLQQAHPRPPNNPFHANGAMSSPRRPDLASLSGRWWGPLLDATNFAWRMPSLFSTKILELLACGPFVTL